jgi:hypothetical protein
MSNKHGHGTYDGPGSRNGKKERTENNNTAHFFELSLIIGGAT